MPIEAESVIDHYKIWLTPELQLTSDILKHVNLKDQFHQEEFKKVVDKLKWIGNPTRKDGRIADHFPPIAHLTGYSIRKPKKEEDEQPTREVKFKNQFSRDATKWKLKEIEYLLLPAWKLAGKEKDGEFPKELPKGDHYLCYAAEGEAITRETTLQDQFDSIAGREETVTKFIPRFFGVPVQKNASKFAFKDAHLAIYEIEPAKKIDPIQISTNDQFARWRDMAITKPLYLAVPTDKITWRVPRHHGTSTGVEG